MKHLIAAGVAVLALSFGSDAFAKGNGNNSSSSAAPAPHRSSSSSTSVSSGATPHYYGGGSSYRAMNVYRGGNRTLVYPRVTNTSHPRFNDSTVRRQFKSGEFQSSTSRFNSSNGGYARVSRNFRQSDNLQKAGNLQNNSAFKTGALGKNKLDPQTSSRLRNWNGNISSTRQARLNHQNFSQHHHNHWWWRHHCAAIIFFDFGWWGWYDGWWYPAWGYDPYSYYDYNEPIYGYDGESPEQIVAGVQAALQERGYYQWAVDGRMGPLTRAALARYQRDHGLPISSGLDPATLGSLGIIR
jgi:hypothetical protein